MTIFGIVLAIGISNTIWEFILVRGCGRGLIVPKSQQFCRRKKSIVYGTSIFESVVDNNKYSNQAILIGNLVTYNLVVISYENFVGHPSDFNDERSNLPKVI